MIAKLIDLFLLATIALTFHLVFFKSLQLYLGQRLFKRPLPAVLAGHPGPLDARKEAVSQELERLEGWLTLLATIAAAAPFVGLMATVMHIIEALSRMSGASLDIGVISGPIATALNSTLIGLASAVPAGIAYNLFSRRIQVLDNAARRALDRSEQGGAQ
jgi:hypothetical protein